MYLKFQVQKTSETTLLSLIIWRHKIPMQCLSNRQTSSTVSTHGRNNSAGVGQPCCLHGWSAHTAPLSPHARILQQRSPVATCRTSTVLSLMTGLKVCLLSAVEARILLWHLSTSLSSCFCNSTRMSSSSRV